MKVIDFVMRDSFVCYVIDPPFEHKKIIIKRHFFFLVKDDSLDLPGNCSQALSISFSSSLCF